MRWPTPVALVAASAAILASGCATKIYQGPTSGRGAEQQLAVSASAEEAFATFKVEPYAGKRVAIRVYGLTERGGGASAEEDYVKNLLTEKLFRKGVAVVEDLKAAELLLAVSLNAAGADVIRRDVPFVYHHTTFRGLVEAKVVAYELKDRTLASIVDTQLVGHSVTYREVYIFYMIGPIRSLSK
jgi:hypothetical protein